MLLVGELMLGKVMVVLFSSWLVLVRPSCPPSNWFLFLNWLAW